jgi:hypothetical protein
MSSEARCWWCGTDLNANPTHECPSKALGEGADVVANALNASENCDHFCCGMMPNVCRVYNALETLKHYGWGKVRP